MSGHRTVCRARTPNESYKVLHFARILAGWEKRSEFKRPKKKLNKKYTIILFISNRWNDFYSPKAQGWLTCKIQLGVLHRHQRLPRLWQRDGQLGHQEKIGGVSYKISELQQGQLCHRYVLISFLLFAFQSLQPSQNIIQFLFVLLFVAWLRRNCMEVFHYVADVLKDTPLFDTESSASATAPDITATQAGGSIYNDFDHSPLDLLHRDQSIFCFSQTSNVGRVEEPEDIDEEPPLDVTYNAKGRVTSRSVVNRPTSTTPRL